MPDMIKAGMNHIEPILRVPDDHYQRIQPIARQVTDRWIRSVRSKTS